MNELYLDTINNVIYVRVCTAKKKCDNSKRNNYNEIILSCVKYTSLPRFS